MGSSNSWGHEVHLLDADSVDRYDRFGERCASGKCVGLPTHSQSWSYITGGRGRRGETTRLICTPHADKFAAKHELTIGPAQPRRTTTMDRIAAGLTRNSQETISVRVCAPRQAGGFWYADFTSVGGNTLGTSSTWLSGVPRNATLAEAVTGAELLLAGRCQVPLGWQYADATATAKVVPAWKAPPWSGQPWNLTVAQQEPDEYDRIRSRPGMWKLTRALAAPFKPDEDSLGWNNMDLNRALAVADRILADHGWTLEDTQWVTAGPGVSVRLGWHPDQPKPVHA